MHLFHIATRDDWEAGRRGGSYTPSTRGRTPADAGVIRVTHRDQVSAIFREHYRGVREPLVLLTIDVDKLTSPWSEQPAGDEAFARIDGPLNVEAVRHVSPLNRRGGSESFTSLFLKEMLTRVALAMIVMVLMSIGVLVGQRQLDTEWGPLIGAGAGLVTGVLVVALLVRRRR